MRMISKVFAMSPKGLYYNLIISPPPPPPLPPLPLLFWCWLSIIRTHGIFQTLYDNNTADQIFVLAPNVNRICYRCVRSTYSYRSCLFFFWFSIFPMLQQFHSKSANHICTRGRFVGFLQIPIRESRIFRKPLWVVIPAEYDTCEIHTEPTDYLPAYNFMWFNEKLTVGQQPTDDKKKPFYG